MGPVFRRSKSNPEIRNPSREDPRTWWSWKPLRRPAGASRCGPNKARILGLSKCRSVAIPSNDPGEETSAMAADYTPRQGQYLAFIYYYTKLHGVPPAEADIQRYFRVSAPAVHEM